MILTYVNPALIPLQIVATKPDGKICTCMTAGTVRVYSLSALGAEVIALAATPLVSAAPLWRYVWVTPTIAEGAYIVEYTLTDGVVTYAPITEDLDVRAATDLSGVEAAGAAAAAVVGLALTGEAAAALTSYDAATGADVTSATSPLATATALATVDGIVDAIKLKTDNLPSDPADQSVVEAAITAATGPLATATALASADVKITAIAADVNGLEAVVVARASMGDDGTTARFVVWLERLGVRLTTITAMSAIVRDKDGTQVVNLGAGVGPSSDNTFSFSCLSTVLPFGVPLSLRTTSTDGVTTWYGAVGFARS